MDLGWMLRRGRGLAYEASGLNRLARARLDGTRACILNYHRVIPEQVASRDAVEGGMYVTPESFRMQLETLKELFRVIPLGELTERVRDRRALPERAAAITFDDGWRDNLDHALPALERAGLPATIFVVTERVGSDGAFWPDEVCRRLAPLEPDAVAELARDLGVVAARADADGVLGHLKSLPEAERTEPLERLRSATELPGDGTRELLTWDELETLRDAGIGIESHGETHAILTGLDRAGAEAELCGSWRTLRERGFGADRLFAYPSGRHDARLHEIAASAGYRGAFVLDECLARIGANPMAVSRLGMHEGIGRTRLEFLCKVPGWS
jgi:peptidoglycan/xylan/chitin deacetylase (PgdA/CDA1 family)